MTAATVPTISEHHRSLAFRFGVLLLGVVLAIAAAKGIYELVDVLDGPGARTAAVTVEQTTVPSMPVRSADGAEQWMERQVHMGTPDATERWVNR
jgi:hypothetical protein